MEKELLLIKFSHHVYKVWRYLEVSINVIFLKQKDSLLFQIKAVSIFYNPNLYSFKFL